MVHDVERPTLHHYLNMNLVVLYIKYLQERRCRPATLAANADVAIKVVRWLLHTNQLPGNTVLAHVQAHLVYLERLRAQTQRNIPPKPPKPVSASQLTPEQLTVMVQNMYNEVVQFATGPGASAMTISEAERLMEVGMACCFWGFLEPLRSSGKYKTIVMVMLVYSDIWLPGSMQC